MQIEPLTRIDQIKQGDSLLISDGERLISTTAKEVLNVGGTVGTEVVFNRKRNQYFNVGMYLSGRSWAKDVRVVTLPSNDRVEGRDAALSRRVPSHDGLATED